MPETPGANSPLHELEEPSEPPKKPGIRLLQTGLLVAGSALLGGFAVALWHRKSLAKLRQPSPAPVEPDADEE
jgi:hypothetical protein